MADPLGQLAPTDAYTASPAEWIGREVGILAGRLAELLARSALSGERVLQDSQKFLIAMAAWAREGNGAAVAGSALDRLTRGVSNPLGRLVSGLGLSPVEVDLLLLAGMTEEHEGYGSVLRTLHPRGEPRASVGLAAQLLCASIEERRLLREVLELGPAVSSGALHLSGDGPFFERSLEVGEGIWPALNGLEVWPAALQPIQGPVTTSGLVGWLSSAAVQRVRTALERGEARLVLFSAESETIALHRAAAVAVSMRVAAVRIALPPQLAPDVERLIGVHALLRGAVPILQWAVGDGPTPFEVPDFRTFPGPVLLCVRAGAALAHGRRPLLSVSVERLSPSARRDLWVVALPELADHAAALAARYSLEPFVADEVTNDVRSLQTLDGGGIRLEDVADSVRARCNLALSGGVKLVRPTAHWGRLILPDEQRTQLREAIDRLVHQPKVLDEWGFLAGRPGARGVRMLFSGPPGTGKTLAAEVMAHELGVDLLIVDLARVVSKWIGETEKNLAAVFDASERAQAVLLFDEADALFGRRTEVSDAHDRYANLETAYLLSRLERFEGLAILSTNLRQNIDPAFIRRLEFLIEFAEPSRSEREALWGCHLPAGTLAPEVDLRELATQYPIVGGLIRNAAVAAGFLAAADRSSITRTHLARAIRREYAKAGRVLPGAPARDARP
jgi:ATPase family protein associated with various cellular activities (AAA)/winged helix domain-containing protein